MNDPTDSNSGKSKTTSHRSKWLLIAVLLIATLFLARRTFISGSSGEAGQWTRVDDQTVALEGVIEQGNFAQFQSEFDDRVTTVILNSGGGDTHEAVQIGMVLAEAQVDVIVRGYCLSSCANYLFTAGQTKNIENGIVVFHGNTTALAAQAGGVDALYESAATPAVRKLSDGSEFKAELAETIGWEDEYFGAQGIPQEFFDISQSLDKGAGDGKTYDFLLPSAEMFSRFGIDSVVGGQSEEWVANYEKEYGGGSSSEGLLVETSP